MWRKAGLKGHQRQIVIHMQLGWGDALRDFIAVEHLDIDDWPILEKASLSGFCANKKARWGRKPKINQMNLRNRW